VIRPIEPRDAEAWSAMRGRLWPEANVDELARETRAFAAGLKQGIVDAAFIAIGDDAQPLGFIELSVRAFSDGCDSMPIPHVEGWYVEDSARGQSVGRALMRAAEEWARSRGFTELASDSELTNENAQRAHTACGFEEVDRLVKFRKPLA